MFSLLDLRFVLCSRDLDDGTTCAKDHGLFYLNYPQINEVRKSGHAASGFVFYPFEFDGFCTLVPTIDNR